MASWGVAPFEVAARFSEEALIELVPALYKRRSDESVSHQLAMVMGAVSSAPTRSQSGSNERDGIARVTRYESGRTGRTYGSASQPLTGAALETAIRDIAKREARARVH